ncbi:pirin family protein [Eisenibacter elegans]|uniref:pirin family protein n=1 Tax=Eisenibacter elegans TaxID=997 RepID=UPI000479158F|nr:pirin family protein [Eisenibacter elegans]
MRTIKRIHKAEYRPIADLITYSPLPTRQLEQIDPFLFLNHHGYQEYAGNNNGLPFGPHPHRGMETVTFIIEGDIMHKDSEGYRSVIKAGGVQWMTAGRGLIHAEVSSEEFKREGGPLEILQLWLNLPAKHKMTAPKYIGLQAAEIPVRQLAEGVSIQHIAGAWEGETGAITPLTDVFLGTLSLKAGSAWQTEVAENRSIFCYVVRGKVRINGQSVAFRNLVEFGHTGTGLQLEAEEESLLIFGHATPFNEPVVAQGPFVMNSMQEIRQAYQDYQAGKFGVWQE